MSKEKTANRTSSFDVDLSGTPEDGQKVTLEREDAIKKIFGTEHPQLADDRVEPKAVVTLLEFRWHLPPQ